MQHCIQSPSQSRPSVPRPLRTHPTSQSRQVAVTQLWLYARRLPSHSRPAVIDAMVQPIPVDTVIIALPSHSIPSLIVAPASQPPRPQPPAACAHGPCSLPKLSRVMSEFTTAFLPKTSPPRTLPASRAPHSRPGRAPSRRSVAVTLCQFWRSVGVSRSLLVMAWCRARIITNVQSGAKTTDLSKTRQGPAIGSVPATAESCRPTLLHPAAQVSTEVPCWNCC